MPDSLTIARTPVLTQSQNYALLRSEGLKHLERLGHELWTDFNIHDPGIAMMELFCYAITDLGYRTGYDIRDLLTESVNGVAVSRGDFHQAQDILTCRPVSFDDLRKLLIDITGVRNAWVSANRNVTYHLDRIEGELSLKDLVDFEEQRLNGLYDVHVEFEKFVETEPRLVYFGPEEKGSIPTDFIKPNGQGLEFNVEYALTIDRVSFYAASPGTVDISLVDRDANLLATTTVNAVAGLNRDVSLGFEIPPGERYRLRASNGPKLRRVKAAALPEPFPFWFLSRIGATLAGLMADKPLIVSDLRD